MCVCVCARAYTCTFKLVTGSYQQVRECRSALRIYSIGLNVCVCVCNGNVCLCDAELGYTSFIAYNEHNNMTRYAVVVRNSESFVCAFVCTYIMYTC